MFLVTNHSVTFNGIDATNIKGVNPRIMKGEIINLLALLLIDAAFCPFSLIRIRVI